MLKHENPVLVYQSRYNRNTISLIHYKQIAGGNYFYYELYNKPNVNRTLDYAAIEIKFINICSKQIIKKKEDIKRTFMSLYERHKA